MRKFLGLALLVLLIALVANWIRGPTVKPVEPLPDQASWCFLADPASRAVDGSEKGALQAISAKVWHKADLLTWQRGGCMEAHNQLVSLKQWRVASGPQPEFLELLS